MNVPDPNGTLWEIPIHTQMVPFWRMLGRKRLQTARAKRARPARARRCRATGAILSVACYPRKLDFCRMTFEEMRGAMAGVLEARSGTAERQRRNRGDWAFQGFR